MQTPSGNKNEKLQPVLLGKSLGLIQYKEKAQIKQAQIKDYLSIF